MKELQDARYLFITHSDDEAIDVLDAWLEDWLYRKEHCPSCGKFSEDDE